MGKEKNLTRDESTKRRRQLIIQTALACFVTKGFHQTSIRDIATKADISLGNLYNYFNSKESLILEIAGIEADEIIKFEKLLNGPSDDPLKTIDKFIDAYFKEVTQPFYSVLAVEVLSEAMRNTNVAIKFNDNRLRIIKALTNALSAGVESGRFDLKMMTEETAELILDTIEGIGFRFALLGKKTRVQSRKSLKWNIRKICLP